MTSEELAEIKADLEAMPAGPWHTVDGEIFADDGSIVCRTWRDLKALWGEGSEISRAHFIAKPPERISALIQEVERLTRHLDGANKNHEHFEREWYLVSDERDELKARVDDKEQEIQEMSDTAGIGFMYDDDGELVGCANIYKLAWEQLRADSVQPLPRMMDELLAKHSPSDKKEEL